MEKNTQRGASVSSHLTNIIRVMKGRSWAGHVARIGERRGSYKVLVAETRGKQTGKTLVKIR